jgi:hypothetical protein
VYDRHISDMTGNESIKNVKIPVICLPLRQTEIPQRILDSFVGIKFADPRLGEREKVH